MSKARVMRSYVLIHYQLHEFTQDCVFRNFYDIMQILKSKVKNLTSNHPKLLKQLISLFIKLLVLLAITISEVKLSKFD